MWEKPEKHKSTKIGMRNMKVIVHLGDLSIDGKTTI
jgi:hypothetical protein